MTHVVKDALVCVLVPMLGCGSWMDVVLCCVDQTLVLLWLWRPFCGYGYLTVIEASAVYR